jgi:acyl-homoserine lactone synthase
MTLILRGSDHSRYSAYFDQMYRLRYEVFVKRRGWSLPHRAGFEIDQYDTDDAVYFLHLTADGAIEASVRMTPSIHSSLMADYFPHLNETGKPTRSPEIYEATRYIISPRNRAPAYQRKLKSTFLLNLIGWCAEQKLSHLQSVIDKAALPSFVEMSMLTQPLGLPSAFGGGLNVPGGGECLGFRWPITKELHDDLVIYGDTETRHQFTNDDHRVSAH